MSPSSHSRRPDAARVARCLLAAPKGAARFSLYGLALFGSTGPLRNEGLLPLRLARGRARDCSATLRYPEGAANRLTGNRG